MFILGFVALISAGTFAQTPTASPDVVIRNGQSWGWFTGTAADTITGATTADALFRVMWDDLYVFTWFLSGDTLTTGTGNVTIQPQGSYDGVTFESIGASTTWTYTNGGYDAATQVNTYTAVNASHTETTAQAVDYMAGWWAAVDTFASSSGVGIYDVGDTTTVAARVNTIAAQTTTITLPGYDYRYIKILCTGASGTKVDIDNIGLKISRAVGKLN